MLFFIYVMHFLINASYKQDNINLYIFMIYITLASGSSLASWILQPTIFSDSDYAEYGQKERMAFGQDVSAL